MEKPGSALVGSIAVHAAVVLGVLGYGLLGFTRAPLKTEMAVPVSIISEAVIEAAAADNPSEELVTEEAATAPVEPAPPEPVPPKPIPPVPTPSPVKKATPPRPTPPRTEPPPRPQPPRPTPPRREETLDLDALSGPPRAGPRPGPRAPTGQQGQGTAPRAVGRASLQALGAQISPRFSCTLPGVENLQIRVSVRLRESGELNGAPRLLPPQGGDGYSAVSAAVIRAIYAAAPFDMPPDYEEQTLTFTFPAARYC